VDNTHVTGKHLYSDATEGNRIWVVLIGVIAKPPKLPEWY